MNIQEIKTKIFLDSGDPKETVSALEMLGFLHEQTTNPSLVAKNPSVVAQLANGNKFSKEEIYAMYKKIVQDISRHLPDGFVSVEVYADFGTSAMDIFQQAKEMNSWIPNARVKIPLTHEGLKAAEMLTKEGIKINMTLVFSQEQVGAVYSATRGAKRGQVCVSPFIGRFDDRGENGIDFIKNVMHMLEAGDGHVEVIAASVRRLDHLFALLQMSCDIATVPFKILQEWYSVGLQVPEDFQYSTELRPIPYQEVDLNKHWQEYDIAHELTTQGVEKFCADWNSLITNK